MHQLTDYELWIGHAGDAHDLSALEAAGIRAVVDLAWNELPQIRSRDLIYCRFPLADSPGNSPYIVQLAIQAVQTMLHARVPTLVFCSAGMSRSPSIVAAALARNAGMDIHNALRIVLKGAKADVSPGLWADVVSIWRQESTQN